jgi:hypothetical protein
MATTKTTAKAAGKTSKVTQSQFISVRVSTDHAEMFAEKSTNAATKLTNLSRASGVAAQDLEKYGLAATLMNAGISAEEASAQLAAFAENLYSIQTYGTGSTELFDRLGRSGRGFNYMLMTSNEAIEAVRKSLKGLDDQAAISVLRAGGFGSEMLPFFRATNEEIETLSSSRLITPEQRMELEEADRIINSIKLDVVALGRIITVNLAKPFKEFTESVKSLASDDGSLAAVSVLFKSIATSALLIANAGQTIKGMGASIGIGLFGRDKDVINDANKENWENVGKKTGANWNAIKEMWKSNNAQKDIIDEFGDSGQKPPTNGTMLGFKDIKPGMYTEEERAQHIKDLFGDSNFGDEAGRYKANGIAENGNGVVNNVKNINVNTTNNIHGGDAQATAGMIGDEFNKQLKHAASDQNNGAF